MRSFVVVVSLRLGSVSHGTAQGRARAQCQIAPDITAAEPTSGLPSALAKRRVMTPLEREASRRLIRLATAAHGAQVKGNCLMAMQMLTRREVIRSHRPWQLMMKHPVWMAFEHRRQQDGLLGGAAAGSMPVTLLEATDARDGEACDTDSNGESEVDGEGHLESARLLGMSPRVQGTGPSRARSRIRPASWGRPWQAAGGEPPGVSYPDAAS